MVVTPGLVTVTTTRDSLEGSYLLAWLDRVITKLDKNLDHTVKKVAKHLYIEDERIIKYVLVSVPMTGLGLGLLAFQIKVLGINPKHAYLYGWFVMTPSNYVVNKIWTWKDREVKQRRSAALWVIVSLMQTAAGQTTFRWLISHEVPWLFANCLVLAVWSPIFYIFKNRVVFRPRKTKAVANAAEVTANA